MNKIEETCGTFLPRVDIQVITGMFLLSSAMFLGGLGMISLIKSKEGGQK